MHTDKPTTIKSEDCFQRYEFSKRIASIIAMPPIDKSLIVGLYGKWGEGKTSVMNFVQQELPEDTAIVNFNPWMFSDEQHLLRSFFASISKELGAKDQTLREKIGGLLSDYSGAIGSVTQFAGFGTEGLEKLGNKLKETSIEQLKTKVDDLIVQSGKNIVVFVDDIDRLDIQEIQYVFKLVKLVGDFPRTAYVLSFDDEMVSAALAPKYGGDNKAAGYNFLEKIIQVPLKIPKASKKALYKYSTGLINSVLHDAGIELNKEEENDFTEAFNTAFLPFMDNPRMAIRYANTLSFSLSLLKGEVNTGNLMVIDGLKVFYPEVYDFIRDNSYLFSKRTVGVHNYRTAQEQHKKIKDKIGASISIYAADKQKAIMEMLQELFPQLKAVYSNTTYPGSAYTRWTKEKKICSGKYFDRYFSYMVQEGDMPDNYFDQLLADLQYDAIENLVTKFTQVVEQYDAFDVIQKFRMREEELNEIQSESLAMVLGRIGHSFPIEEDMHFATTYAQPASLIARLIRNIKPPKRLSFILDLLSASTSLEYAMEIHYWLMYREKNYPTTAIFSEEDEGAMQQHLVTLFKKEMTDENFFTVVSDGNLWRILAWWNLWDDQKDILKAFWNKHLDGGNHEFALKLIKVFTPTINASSYNPQNKHVNNSTYKSGFYEANFNALKKAVDVSLLNKNLVAFYGDNPHDEGPSVISDRDPIDDKTLVSIFQWFVEKTQS